MYSDIVLVSDTKTFVAVMKYTTITRQKSAKVRSIAKTASYNKCLSVALEGQRLFRHIYIIGRAHGCFSNCFVIELFVFWVRFHLLLVSRIFQFSLAT